MSGISKGSVSQDLSGENTPFETKGDCEDDAASYMMVEKGMIQKIPNWVCN
jgi:hypothetical protein